MKKTLRIILPALLMTAAVMSQSPGEGEYNGFKVSGRYLYDQCGEKVILRGINAFVLFWDGDGSELYPEIEKTGANCVRIFWRTGHKNSDFIPPARLDRAIQNCIDHQMIPMVCVWDATGKAFGGEEWQDIVNYWTDPRVIEVLKKHEDFLLLNIANEVGKNDVTNELYRESYGYVIDTLRKAGVRMPLVIDASNWGRNEQYIIDNAEYLVERDPLQNLMFSWHPWDNGTSKERVDTFFETSKEMNLPVIVGEFSAKDVFDRPYEEPLIWKHIMQRCHEYEIGYLPWWWASQAEDEMHEITEDGIFGHWANDSWGKEVAVESEYSIQNTSVRPKSLLGEECK